MKFINDTDKDRMVQIREGGGVSRWISINAGETMELDQRIGEKHGLTKVDKPEPVESKAGPKKVETKKIKPKKKVEKERLIAVKGVNEEIADAILLRFRSIKDALEAGVKGLMKVPAIGKARAKRIMKSLS